MLERAQFVYRRHFSSYNQRKWQLLHTKFSIKKAFSSSFRWSLRSSLFPPCKTAQTLRSRAKGLIYNSEGCRRVNPGQQAAGEPAAKLVLQIFHLLPSALSQWHINLTFTLSDNSIQLNQNAPSLESLRRSNWRYLLTCNNRTLLDFSDFSIPMRNTFYVDFLGFLSRQQCFKWEWIVFALCFGKISHLDENVRKATNGPSTK